MNERTLNRELVAARGAAARLEPLLVKAWASVIQAASQRAAREFTSRAVLVAASWQPPPDEDALFDEEATAKSAGKTRRARERVLEAAGDVTSISFDVKATAPQAFLDSLGPRTDQVIQGIRPAVAKAIETGYEEGLSVPQTASLIREEVAALKDWQATALARTDLNAIANGGNHLAVQQINASSKASREKEFKVKTWRTANDDRVRDAHIDAEGQTVPVDQPFNVDGEHLNFPGDPWGSPENTWNCRCAVTYSYDEAAAKKLKANHQAQLPLAASAATATEDKIGGAMAKDSELSAASVTVIVGDEQAATSTSDAQSWQADLAFEGVPTDDGRFMVVGSLSWRDPPMTLLALTENTEGGHLGADSAGSIQTVEKVAWTDPDSFVVRGTGVFDSGEFGQETARMVEEGTLGYVSVDLAIREYGFRDPDTGEILDPAEMTDQQWMDAFMGVLQFAVIDGVIGAATVVPFSAFADSRIEMTADAEIHLTLQSRITLAPSEPLLACSAGPLCPPGEWFEDPELGNLTPLTVTVDGRVYGHAATWECHNGFADRCMRAQPSSNGYAYFHTGMLETDGGRPIRVGRITVKPHADYGISMAQASSHYDDAGRVAAFVRAYDDEYGIAVAGVTRSDASPELLRDFLANPPSGDWRQGELLGFSSVPLPGLPVVVPEARLIAAADGEPNVEVLLLPAVTEQDVLLASIMGEPREPIELVNTQGERVEIEALAGTIIGD